MAEDLFLLDPEHAGFARRSGLLVPKEYATEGPMPAGVIVVGRDVTEAVHAQVSNFQGTVGLGERAVLLSYPHFLDAILEMVEFEAERQQNS